MRCVSSKRARRFWLAFSMLTACGPKPPVRTALVGQLADLKREVRTAQQAGKLDSAAAVELARAVAERELTSARGTDGALRVRGLRACALPLQSSIEHRARTEDDVGAELGLILVEARRADRPTLLNQYVRSPSGGLRAVAARAAVRPIDSDVRKSFFVDSDERVRRAAFAAAYEAGQTGELEALLESARLDPDPYAQSLAIRAVGAIGGERAVLALKDLWPTADDALRIAIVDAWSEAASLNAGGARELGIAADSGAGLAPVSASYALSRTGGAESVAANARLRRAISNGTDDEKRLAIRVTPLDAATEAALLEAAHGASPELRVLAWSRLSALPARHTKAVASLREELSKKASSNAEAHAHEAALSALSQAGDVSVEPALVKNLQSPDLQTRWRAASGLVNLGDYTDAATALADDDANLRCDIACSILAKSSR